MSGGGTFTNKVKGFTLIELLAVIIILAVLALILVPTITNIIETSRKESFKDSAYGLVETAKLYYSTKMTANMGSFTTTTFTVQNGTMAASNGDTLDFNGQTPVGDSWIKINDEGNVSMLITNGKYYASKDADEVAVAVTETEDGALTREELTTEIANLKERINTLEGNVNTNSTNISNLSTVTASSIFDLNTNYSNINDEIFNLKLADTTITNKIPIIKNDVLWTNSNESASFVAQTINLSSDYSNYDYLVIDFTQLTTAHTVLVDTKRVNETIYGAYVQTISDGSVFGVLRSFYINQNSKITFSDSSYRSTTNPGGGVINNLIIPVSVKGIKL